MEWLTQHWMLAAAAASALLLAAHFTMSHGHKRTVMTGPTGTAHGRRPDQ